MTLDMSIWILPTSASAPLKFGKSRRREPRPALSLAGSVSSAGEAPGSIFRPPSARLKACPSQQSGKDSSWPLRPRAPSAATALLLPLGDPISSQCLSPAAPDGPSPPALPGPAVEPAHWGHGDRRRCAFPGERSSRQRPEDSETMEPDVLVTPRRQSLASRHTLMSFDRGGFSRGLVPHGGEVTEGRDRPEQEAATVPGAGRTGDRVGHGRPGTSWMRLELGRDCRHLGAPLTAEAQRGASLFPCPPSHPAVQLPRARHGRKLEGREVGTGRSAGRGTAEQSRGRAGPGAESQPAVTVTDPPLRSLTLLPPHPGDQHLKSL